MSAVTMPLKWFYHEFGVDAIHDTGRNAYLIIIARSCRMFAYGTNSFFLGTCFRCPPCTPCSLPTPPLITLPPFANP